MLIFSEQHLRNALAVYVGHYNGRSPHQSRQLRSPRPDQPVASQNHTRVRRRRLGGLINNYEPAA